MNMFPNQVQPVQRKSPGSLTNNLSELSEERLAGGDVNASICCCFCEAESVNASICLCLCEADAINASICCCFCEAEGA